MSTAGIPNATAHGVGQAHRSRQLWAARLGLARGWIEFKQNLKALDNVIFQLLMVFALGAVLFFQRDSIVDGQSLASLTLPSILGMLVALGSAQGVAGYLAVEREDGTLLRAKATPHGMTAYVVAKVTSTSLGTLVQVVLILATGIILVSEHLSVGLGGWLTLAGVVVLGFLAIMPWAAIIGSFVRSPNSAFGLVVLPIGALTAISGVFYVITALPTWLQAIAQVFPVYWLGHGMRSALLPDAALAAEIGESWRLAETVGVLGAWALVGLFIAPPILRRMARRESGATMQERRERAMQRI
jgi:ABC-2 type transport system permease protein